MRFLVTGSAGHLGEALVRTLRELDHEVVGLDILESPFTTYVGSITERSVAMHCMSGVQVVFHAATLHKPHVATHSRQEFVDTNITGTLNLLEAAVSAGVGSFVYTSTTSVFGDALVPPPGAPAAWITEEVTPVPKNIYGATKTAAEDLCQLFHGNQGLACIVLRTSRFFPEEDDNDEVREAFSDDNVKANEYLYRLLGTRDTWASPYSRFADRGTGYGVLSAASAPRPTFVHAALCSYSSWAPPPDACGHPFRSRYDLLGGGSGDILRRVCRQPLISPFHTHRTIFIARRMGQRGLRRLRFRLEC